MAFVHECKHHKHNSRNELRLGSNAKPGRRPWSMLAFLDESPGCALFVVSPTKGVVDMAELPLGSTQMRRGKKYTVLKSYRKFVQLNDNSALSRLVAPPSGRRPWARTPPRRTRGRGLPDCWQLPPSPAATSACF